MFGYISVNKPELKIKDYDTYHAYYCGLCKELKHTAGNFGRLTLTYDMTFLSVLLAGLYEPEEKKTFERCIVHPEKRHESITHKYTKYAADMNLLLSYYNLLDDWRDDKHITSKALADGIKKQLTRIKREYPRQTAAVTTYMTRLISAQDHKLTDIDKVAGYTGEMLGEIFAARDDEWAPSLKRLGFYMGKYIYLMDAYLDREEDTKHEHYNIWNVQEKEYTEEEAISIMNMMMGECAITFEALPIIKNAEILRNIIYSGVWIKYEIKRNKGQK